MAGKNSTFIGGDLGSEAKGSLTKLTGATNAPNGLECMRQLFIHLERARQRAGVETFAFGDIQIDTTNREKKEAA